MPPHNIAMIALEPPLQSSTLQKMLLLNLFEVIRKPIIKHRTTIFVNMAETSHI